MKHKQLCSAIKYLSSQEKRDTSDSGMYVSHLTPNQHAKVAKLVGKRCMVECVMNPKFLLFLRIGLLRTCPQLRVVEWMNCLMTKDLI